MEYVPLLYENAICKLLEVSELCVTPDIFVDVHFRQISLKEFIRSLKEINVIVAGKIFIFPKKNENQSFPSHNNCSNINIWSKINLIVAGDVPST